VIEIERRFRLYERRCDGCGRFWACEFEHIGICPMCAQLKVDEVKASRAQLQRVANALRGALARKRNHVREKA
jgi:rRNA maturation endonuclease Nob1